MNRRVAHRARLILLRLVVERRRSGRATCIRGESMAFQAYQVHLRPLQESRVGGPVRHVARRASFYLHGFMLVHEGSRLVRVALEAHQVLRPCRPQLSRLEPAMLVMAVGALHQSFVHSMMEGPVELLLLIQVATVTKCRLLLLQQKLALFCMVRVVAIGAADTIL